MKPYEGCAVCAVNELRKECDSCVFTLASKEELLRRLLDNVHYTQYEHKLIKEALLKEYDFDYAIRYEGKTPQQLLQQTIDDARKQMPIYQQIMLDHLAKEIEMEKKLMHIDNMRCDGGNCYKCLFWKPSYLNICENQFFTLASEKELIRRLDANEYETRRDDIIKTLKEQYGYDYETKSITDLDSGIRFKNRDDMISALKYWWRVANTDYLKRFETNNEGDDVSMHIDNMINMDNGKRISKVEYYLGIADAVSKRGTCLRRNYGSVIVKDDHIVSTGYNGAPRGRVNCCDLGTCWRKSHNIPQYADYSKCRSCHAEMNAIINASSEEMNNATLYLVGRNYDDDTFTDADCCTLCKRMVINAGIKTVIVRLSDGSVKQIDVEDWIRNDDTLNM